MTHTDYTLLIITSSCTSHLTRERNRHLKTERETCIDMYPYTGTAASSSPTLPQCLSQNKGKVLHQTIFTIEFPLTNTFCRVMKYQHKLLPLEGDLHHLKGLCGHINITQDLKSYFHKACNSRTLEPCKGSQAEALCAHPASQCSLGILHPP